MIRGRECWIRATEKCAVSRLISHYSIRFPGWHFQTPTRFFGSQSFRRRFKSAELWITFIIHQFMPLRPCFLGTGRDLLPCYCPNFRQAKSDAGLESRVDSLRVQVFYTTYFRSASAIKQLLFVKHRSDDLTLRFRKCNRLIIAERDHPVGFQKIDRISVICLEQLRVSAGTRAPGPQNLRSRLLHSA